VYGGCWYVSIHAILYKLSICVQSMLVCVLLDIFPCCSNSGQRCHLCAGPSLVLEVLYLTLEFTRFCFDLHGSDLHVCVCMCMCVYVWVSGTGVYSMIYINFEFYCSCCDLHGSGLHVCMCMCGYQKLVSVT
jgi:hypothetical protein